MDLRQLRYFSAVFERRNLTHAAEYCCVAQSAISHHLAALEAELAVRLFERLPRGMEPTPAGARLYEHARSILRSVEAASADVHFLSEDVTGKIQIGLSHTVLEAIAVPLLLSIRDRLPKAEIVIVEALSDDLYRLVLAGEHDLVLCYNPLPDERLKISHVHSEPLCCVGHRDLIGDRADPIDFEVAMGLPKIVLKAGGASRAVSNHARMLEALQSSAEFRLNSVVGMRKAIASGVAVAICPYITVRELANEGHVIARPIVNPLPERSLSVVRLSDRSPTRLMALVQEIVIDLIREQTSDGSWPIVPALEAGVRQAAMTPRTNVEKKSGLAHIGSRTGRSL